MKIHALQTGTVRVKESFLHPSPGRRRQLDLFLPGAWDAVATRVLRHGGVKLGFKRGYNRHSGHGLLERFDGREVDGVVGGSGGQKLP